MNGRIYVLILLFWAFLTIVTPMLIHLSASAKLNARFDGERRQAMKDVSARRALGKIRVSPAPAPPPAPEQQHLLWKVALGDAGNFTSS